jgi:hypothetical protein
LPSSRSAAALAVAVGSLVFASAANAATLAVDDDGSDCPTAPYASIQAAIDAAADGDTIAVCAGTYVEGTGAVGTNALTIAKSLAIKGAGADLVRIMPRRTLTADPAQPYATLGQIAKDVPDVRTGGGSIVAVVGTPAAPLTVRLSGMTVDGNRVFSEAAVLFRDAGGSVTRSRITNVVTSQQASAQDQPGGYRSNNVGFGIAQVTAANAPGETPELLAVTSTRVDKYNKAGILVDGATGDALPLTPSGVTPRATITASQIIGRTMCINFAADGNCSSVGTLTDGTLFGQDGIRLTAGGSATVINSIVSQNLVNGTGAPVRGAATNNSNLPLGAGVRLLGAGETSITRSNIVDNAYGVLNLNAAGTTSPAPVRVSALVGAAQHLPEPATGAAEPRPGDPAPLEPARAREPGQRRHDRGRRREHLDPGRLLPVSQRAARRPGQRAVGDPRRAAGGRRCRAHRAARRVRGQREAGRGRGPDRDRGG